ncbi:MAG TPA: glycosyltransferase, partial [Actinotalea sp.]|nr:glycosyltransferase [Actinotalea sp.]
MDAGASGAPDDLRRAVADVPGIGVLAPRLVSAAGAPTFGHAVRTALGEVDLPPDGWLWLLHDDSAPAPAALAELLRAVEVAPSVAVAGVKQVSWTDPVRVLEVGMTTSRFGRRMTGLDEPEVDQGQHDGREDVLGVGLAGALVRRDVWDLLGGPDPALGPYGDGLDVSRRARLAGHRVVVVPGAVVRHARASLTGQRPDTGRRRSARARRVAFLHSQLSGVPVGLVPVVVVLAVLSGVGRALLRLVTKEPDLVLAELGAPWAVLARPGRVVRARRTATATRRVRRSTLRPLQVSWREVAGQARDRRLAAAERRRITQAPSELELAELAALRTRRRVGLAVVLLAAGAVSVLTLGPLVSGVLSGARLSGGGLALGDADLGGLWSVVTTGWVPGGLGRPGPTDPVLLALLPGTALLGGLGASTAAVQLGALLLGALGAWFAAGAVTRSVGLRTWAALVWTAAPALLLATSQGRVGAVLAHVALPWVALGVARAVGVARVDGVESGLVGAQRVGAGDQDSARPVVRRGPPPVRSAEPSLAAAAGAGLAFALVTAGAPVLLPAGLLALLL